MNPVFRLIRLPNLIIIVVTQYLLQYLVILPVFSQNNIQPFLDHLHFAMLSLTTILIGASGFIINDLFDVKIDQINKPDEMIIGRLISRRQAWQLYAALTIAGLVISLFLSLSLGIPELFFIYPLALGLLALYSIKLQQWFLIGNVIVAIYCAFVTGIIAIAEWPSFFHLHIINYRAYDKVVLLLAGFAIFSFAITLYREIVKDMEDEKGDAEAGQKTLAIVLGQQRSKGVSAAVATGLIISLAFWMVLRWNDVSAMNLIYGFIFLEIPLIFSIYILFKAQSKADFSKLSKYLKWMMMSGMIYLFFN